MITESFLLGVLAILAVPFVVYYYVVKKDWKSSFWSNLKVMFLTLLLGLGRVALGIKDTHFWSLVLGILAAYIVLFYWHVPKGDFKQALKWYLISYVIQFIISLLIIGIIVWAVWDINNMMSIVGGLK